MSNINILFDELNIADSFFIKTKNTNKLSNKLAILIYKFPSPNKYLIKIDKDKILIDLENNEYNIEHLDKNVDKTFDEVIPDKTDLDKTLDEDLIENPQDIFEDPEDIFEDPEDDQLLEFKLDKQFDGKIDDQLEMDDYIDVTNVQNVGLKKITRKLNIWERDYSDEVIIESIIQNILDKKYVSNISEKLYDKLYIKAKNILNYVYKSTDSKLKNKINIKGNNYKPIINNFYNSKLIYPIVSDKKKIYTKKKELLDNIEIDDDINLYKKNIFIDENIEMEIQKQLYKKYQLYKNSSFKDPNTLNYNELIQSLNSNGNIIIEDFEVEDNIEYYSINKPFINSELNYTQYVSNPIKFNQNIFRACIPEELDTCFSIKNIKHNNSSTNFQKNINFQKRLAEKGENIYTDNFDERKITDKIKGIGIKTCTGTNISGEKLYRDKNSTPLLSNYNKSISIPPNINVINKSEKLNIIGVFIKSNIDFQPNFNQIEYITYKNTDKIYRFPEKFNNLIYKFPAKNDKGFTLVDHIKFNINNIQNLNRENKSINTNFSVNLDYLNNPIKIDYSKNNFLYFNKFEKKNINKNEFNKIIDNILPNITSIFKIENKNIQNCCNFDDLNKILCKYKLSIEDLNLFNIQNTKLKDIFVNNIIKNLNAKKINIIYNIKFKLKNNLHKALNYKLKKFFIKIQSDTRINFSNILNFNFKPKSEFIEHLSNKMYSYVYPIFKIESLNDLTDFIKHNFNYLLIKSDDSGDLKEFIIKKIINLYIHRNFYNLNIFTSKLNLFIHKNLGNNSEYLNKILKIYKFKNLNQLNNNYYNNIDLISKLSKTFDNGNLIKLLFKYIELNSKKETIQNEIIYYSKLYFLSRDKFPEFDRNNSSHSKLNTKLKGEKYTITEWNKLKNPDKKQYFKNIELYLKDQITKYRTNYEIEKKKFIIYAKKCKGFYVVKEYFSKTDLIKDNNKLIYYDEKFDTIKIDIDYANTILKTLNLTPELIKSKHNSQKFIIELKKFLNSKYIFNTAEYINKKIKNILYYIKNKKLTDTQTKFKSIIFDNNYCLLNVNDDFGNKKRYLYIRKNNIWQPLLEEDILTNKNCLSDLDIEKKTFLNILSLNFDEFLELGVKNIDDYDTNELVNKCVHINKNITKIENIKCLPKILQIKLIQIRNINSKLNIIQNLTKSKQIIDSIIMHSDIILNHKIQNYLKKQLCEQIDNTTPIQTKPIVKSIIPFKLKKIWYNINKIIDEDIKLTKIKEFIDKYGKFKDIDIDKNIYWNYPNANEKLCCIHYLDFCEMRWKSNNSRKKIFDNIIRKYTEPSSKNVLDDNIVCKYCGEPISKIKKSIIEGYAGEAQIKVREVIDENLFDNANSKITYKYNIEQNRFKKILTLFTTIINVKLTINDIDFILKNSEIEFKNLDNIEAFYINSKDLNNFKIKKYENYLQIHSGYIELIENKNIKFGSDPNNIFNCVNVNKLGDKFKIFKIFILGYKSKTKKSVGIIHQYQSYIYNHKIAIILANLVLVLIYSDPSYNVKGMGNERTTKLGLNFFGDFYNNQMESINYLLKVFKHIRKANLKQPNVLDINNIIWKFTLPIQKTKKYNEFKTKYFDIYYNKFIKNKFIVSKIQNKLKSIEVISNLFKSIEEIDIKWQEFKPNLIAKYNFTYDLSTINNLIDLHVNNTNDINSMIKSLNTIDINLLFQFINNNENESKVKFLKSKKILINLQNFLPILGYYMISLINKTIFNNSDNKFYKNITYNSVCCYQFINNNYYDYFIDDKYEMQQIINNSNLINNHIENNKSSLSFLINFNDLGYNRNLHLDKSKWVNSSLPNSITNPKYRLLLNYMYSQSNLRKDLIDKYIKINEIIITDLFVDKTNKLFGKKRIFKYINDPDFYLLEKVYNELTKTDSYNINKIIPQKLIRLKLSEILKEKYKDFDYTEDFIDKKCNIILDYNGEYYIDIISNQYKHDIITKVINKIKFYTDIEIKKELNNFIQYQNITNKLYINRLPMYEYNINFYNYKKIYEKHFQFIFKTYSDLKEICITDELIDLYTIKPDVIKQEFQSILSNTDIKNMSILEKSNIEQFINKFYNKYFKINNTSIIDYLNTIFNSTNLFNYKNKNKINDYITFLNTSLDYQKCKNEYENYYNNLLKILNFKDTSFISEKEFIKRELINNNFNSQKNININHFTKYFINLLNSIYFRLKNSKDFYDKDIIKFKSYNFYLFKQNNSDISNNIYNKYWSNINKINSYSPQNKIHIIHALENIFNYKSFDKNEFTKLLNIVNNIYQFNDIYNSKNIKLVSIINSQKILEISKFIFYYILYKLLKNLVTYIELEEIREFIQIILINIQNYISNFNDNNYLTEDSMKLGIKNYKALLNRRRKNKFTKLIPELQNIQKLYRKFGLGKQFKGWDDKDNDNDNDNDNNNDQIDNTEFDSFESKENGPSKIGTTDYLYDTTENEDTQD